MPRMQEPDERWGAETEDKRGDDQKPQHDAPRINRCYPVSSVFSVLCFWAYFLLDKTRRGTNADGDFCHIIPNWFKTSAYQVKSLVELMTAFIKPKDG